MLCPHSSSDDNPFKIILIGDSDVGKSNILRRYYQGSFKEQRMSTIAPYSKFKTIAIDGKPIKLHIWDIAGHERVKAITKSNSKFYRGADGIILVYDITDKESFQAITNWFRDIQSYANDMVILLIGNKCDATDGRRVSIGEGHQLAKQLGINFLECSAKTGANIETAFLWMSSLIMSGQFNSQDIEIRHRSAVDVTALDQTSRFGHIFDQNFNIFQEQTD